MVKIQMSDEALPQAYMKYLQQGHHPQDKDTLSLMKEALESSVLLWDDTGKHFLELANKFLDKGGNPNTTFQSIEVGSNTYRNPTFFHLVYLQWKDQATKIDEITDKDFEEIMDRMLDDPRVDLEAKFSEESLCDSEHFFKRNSYTYSGQNEEEGYSIENMNIAHYTMVKEDIPTLHKILERAPHLLNSTCCMTKGKGLLQAEVMYVVPIESDKKKRLVPTYIYNPRKEDLLSLPPYKSISKEIIPLYNKYVFEPSSDDIDKLESLDDDVSGILALATVSLSLTEGVLFPVSRITKVSLFHLAARLGYESGISYLYAKKANPFSQDSSKQIPLHYLQNSLFERLVKKTNNTKALMTQLEPITRLNKSFLPQTCMMIKRSGYYVNYNTATKVANFVYERLDKNSLLKNTDRSSSSFKPDTEIPKLNRSELSDYAYSGFDRGHLVPASDAVSSETAMDDTFLLSNIAPQKPEFNRGYWKSFEKSVRKLVDKYDLIEVFTGCLFVPETDSNNKSKVSFETIGSDHVAVPTHFYKVLYLHNQSTKSIAYMMPNSYIDPSTSIKNFKVSIDTIQKLSGTLFNTWRS